MLSRSATWDQERESNGDEGAPYPPADVATAGYDGAATLAEQIDSVEAYRPQDSFGDAMKGLHVYGYKVTQPVALSSVVATSA